MPGWNNGQSAAFTSAYFAVVIQQRKLTLNPRRFCRIVSRRPHLCNQGTSRNSLERLDNMHFEYRKNRPEEVSFIVDSLAHVENVAPLLVANSISIISASAATLLVLTRLVSSVTRGFCCRERPSPGVLQTRGFLPSCCYRLKAKALWG